jgi:hypothetical protein
MKINGAGRVQLIPVSQEDTSFAQELHFNILASNFKCHHLKKEEK